MEKMRKISGFTNVFKMSVLSGAALILGGVGVAEASTVWQDKLYDDYNLEVNGFVEGRLGTRIRQDHNEKDLSISEARLQLDINKMFNIGVLKVKGDLVADQVMEEFSGSLREANYSFSPADMIDLKIGRQVLTWGTGDLVFINDMFPKDWQSFFIGRDNEYLKAPSDAIKTSLFLGDYSLNLVYTPLFNGSDYINGERLSFYNKMAGSFAGRDQRMIDDERNSVFDDAEYAVRLATNVGSAELALYGYSGFWQEPEGVDMNSGLAFYPRISVYGASGRAPIFGGIGNIETGYYDSREDASGEDPSIRNGEIRFLIGYERELGSDFTGAIQYYLEWMQDYGQYEQTLPVNMPMKDEYRHMVTIRLTKMALDQRLILSVFNYYSPSDRDGYIRPKVTYKIDDNWQVEGGANIFWGDNDYTFWGSFKKNSNVFSGLRYSF